MRNPGLGKLIEKIVSNPAASVQDVLDGVKQGTSEKVGKIFDEHNRVMKPNEIREDLNANMEKVRFSYMLIRKITYNCLTKLFMVAKRWMARFTKWLKLILLIQPLRLMI
ncbi:hypothetical protein [Mycoplasma sp. ATU-Cv-508]|uniref:hypothetical protein n=1 Tax=Mycoplasma sp. ATU-Cv-508 TaxID=2048001 RepID=UPI000FDCDF72